jgi:hypothetical protein
MKGSRDQVLYTALGYVALAGIIVVVAVVLGEIVTSVAYWMPSRQLSEGDFARWFTWIVCTPALFWWIIKWFPRPSRDRVFWPALAGLFVVHVACFIEIFRRVEHWRIVWTPMLMTVEVACIFVVLEWATTRFGKHRRSKPVATHHPRLPPEAK